MATWHRRLCSTTAVEILTLVRGAASIDRRTETQAGQLLAESELTVVSFNNLVDGSVDLPEAASKSFWLHGSVWQFPDYDNADTFVAGLVRESLLVRDPIVNTVLQNQPQALSPRSVQRRFLRATGLTQGSIRQIERARYATTLLQQGVSVLDTVDLAGYADQPHLTRSLKHFIGKTPAQIIRQSEPEQMSLLFKTAPFL